MSQKKGGFLKFKNFFKIKYLLIFFSSLFLFVEYSEAQRRRTAPRSRPAMSTPRQHSPTSNRRTVIRGDLFSIGGGIAFNSVNQVDINKTIRAAKTSGSANTPELKTAMEYMGFVSYRFSKYPVAVQFRPSYYTQTTTGSGTGGSYNYDVIGYTFFPIVRYIPWTNENFDFFIQAGAGYAMMNGKITNAARRVSFSGANFGTVIGAGADFCFYPRHCFGAEGNYRYLSINKNDIKSASAQIPYGLDSDTARGRELEDAAGKNISTYLTGYSAVIYYTYYF